MTKSEVISSVIGIAEEEIGYLEKRSNANLDSKTANAGSNNYTKYWRDIKPSYQGQPWCAAFVSWCFMKAFGQAKAKKLLKHWPYVYCPTLGSLFTRYANPQVGDIVIFYRGGTFTHTGIVTKVKGGKFWTIEGNTSGASGIIANGGGVCEKSYYNSNLPGTKFCRPDWGIVASTEAPGKKTTDELAKEVIDGKWGTGDARKAALEKAGYDYAAIQKRVNEILSGSQAKKSVDEIAKEVIAGKWGTGDTRKKKLEAAGYNYSEVQSRVNAMLR